MHEANQEWEKAKWATITERLNEAVNFEYRPDTLRTRYDELYRTGFTGLRANPLSEQPLERCADGGWPVIEPLPATTRADPAAVDDSDHESVEGHYLHTEPRPFGSTGARYDDYPNPPWKGGSNSSVSPITGNTGNPPPLIATPDNVAGTISNIMEQDPHAGLSAFASNQLLLQQQNVEGSHEASTPDDEGDQVNIVDAGIDIAGNDSNSEHSDDALVPPDPSSNVNDADAFSGFGDEEDPGAEEDVTASLAGNDDDGATIETPAIEEEATPDQRGTTEPGGNVDDTTNVEAAAHGGITSNHIDDIRDLPESSSRKKNWAERTHRPGLDDDDDD